MFARVSTFRGPAQQIDEAIRYVREHVLPWAKDLDEFKGAYFLVDRHRGESVSITLWESEEAMRASEEAANTLRSDAAEATSGEVASVRRYEVAISPEGHA